MIDALRNGGFDTLLFEFESGVFLGDMGGFFGHVSNFFMFCSFHLQFSGMGAIRRLPAQSSFLGHEGGEVNSLTLECLFHALEMELIGTPTSVVVADAEVIGIIISCLRLPESGS